MRAALALALTASLVTLGGACLVGPQGPSTTNPTTAPPPTTPPPTVTMTPTSEADAGLACAPDAAPIDVADEDASASKLPKDEVVFALDGVVIELRPPPIDRWPTPRGQILMLPGWSFDRRETCWRSSFCDDALAAGYLLVLAGMDKSVYAGTIYPETRYDMAHYKTRTWVTERLLPELQRRFDVLLPGGDNYLYGMSTGGRGVAMLALHTQGLFKAGAALSGDFDMTMEKTDPLLVLHYGSFTRFPERWTGDDNPASNVERISVPLFIGTGTADRTVPMQQALAFHAKLRAAHPDLDVELSTVEGGGHDFTFWGSQTARILAFFAAHGAPVAGSTP